MELNPKRRQASNAALQTEKSEVTEEARQLQEAHAIHTCFTYTHAQAHAFTAAAAASSRVIYYCCTWKEAERLRKEAAHSSSTDPAPDSSHEASAATAAAAESGAMLAEAHKVRDPYRATPVSCGAAFPVSLTPRRLA